MSEGTVRSVSALALVAAAACGFVAAQDEAPPAAAPRESDVEERVRVVLVQLPLIATNRHGEPVTDLTAEEIVVEENGRKLPVAYLDRLVRQPAGVEELAPVRLFVAAPGGWQLPQSSTPGRPEYVLFFIDNRNDDPLQRDKATDDLIAFARAELGPSIQAAVASFDGELHLDLPFTTDREALASALGQARSRRSGPIKTVTSDVRQLLQQLDECVLPGETMMRMADDQCLRDISREYLAQKRTDTEAFLDALSDTVRFLGGLDGRKRIYAMSHGVVVDATLVVAEAVRSVLGNASQVASLQTYLGTDDPVVWMDRLMHLALRNQVSLNFVDRMRAPTMDTGASSGRLGYPGAAPARTAYTAAQNDLNEMAAATGGIFKASTRLGDGMRHVHELQEAAYELGYRLDEEPNRDRLARISVSTTRRGVRLTHRRGASRTPGEDTFPLGGRITLRPSTRPESERSAGLPYDFTVQADPRQIGYVVEGADAAATFTLHVVVEDDTRRQRVGSYHLIQHAYPADLWRTGDVEPITLHGWVELPPGTFTLRAIFRNTASGRQGELATTLTVLPDAG